MRFGVAYFYLGKIITKRRELMTKRDYGAHASNTGYLLGSALAMILSFSLSKSILWTIFHGLFSWLYVIYFAIFH